MTLFGEHNSSNNLHGRGICIWSSGVIFIGYYDDGEQAPGDYIIIESEGMFIVGTCYLKDGGKRCKGTHYNTDGSTEEFDDWV